MTYIEKEQDVLNRWKTKFCKDKSKDNEYANCNPADYFAEDGIMFKGAPTCLVTKHDDGNTTYKWVHDRNGKENEMWEKAPLRILYLTKDQYTYGDKTWDVRSESYRYLDRLATEDDLSTCRFHKNLVYSLFGLLKTTPDHMVGYDDFTDAQALRLSEEQIFARINCRKEYGNSSCSDDKLSKAIDAYKDFLCEQIRNLEADVFICCGSHNDKNIILDNLNEFYGGKFKWITYATWYNEEDNILAIDSYHLSYIKGGYRQRYEDIVKTYFDFIKYLKTTKGIDFTKHR